MATENQHQQFFIPPWVAVAFWVAYIVHVLVSGVNRGWFTAHQGDLLGIIKFLVLSLSYTTLGAAFHAACKIPEPSIIYGRILKNGTAVPDVTKTVGTAVKETFFGALVIWAIFAFLLIGYELYP
jgi:hypothetical protein